MRKRSATKSSKNKRKEKQNKGRGRGPSQQRMPAGLAPNAFGALNQPNAKQTDIPGLPPGMQMPDLSKLKLPPK